LPARARGYSLFHPQLGSDFERVAGDQLHPSGKMYAMWAEKILPTALDILKDK
jgi:lysophospholipase L1-like esterase